MLRKLFILLIFTVLVYTAFPASAYGEEEETIISDNERPTLDHDDINHDDTGTGGVVTDIEEDNFFIRGLEVILNAIFEAIIGVAELLTDGLIGGTLDSIILQKGGIMSAIDSIDTGAPGAVPPNPYTFSIYAFNFDTGNPYGIAAGIGYSIIASIGLVVMAISFIWIICKAIMGGGSVQAHAAFKEDVQIYILRVAILLLAPYILELTINIRDSISLYIYEFIYGPYNGGYFSGFISGADYNGGGLLYIFLAFVIKSAYYGVTFYYAYWYVLLSVCSLLLVIALAFICAIGENFKKRLSGWLNFSLSIFLSPIIDILVLAAPGIILVAVSEAQSITGYITNELQGSILVVFTMLVTIKARMAIRDYIGLPKTGADMLGSSIEQFAKREAAKAIFKNRGRMSDASNKSEAEEYDNKANMEDALAREDDRFNKAKEAFTNEAVNEAFKRAGMIPQDRPIEKPASEGGNGPGNDEDISKKQAAKNSRFNNEGGVRRLTESPYSEAQAKGDTLQDAIDANAKAQSRQQADIDALSRQEFELGKKEEELEKKKKSAAELHQQTAEGLRAKRAEAVKGGEPEGGKAVDDIDNELSKNAADYERAASSIDGQLKDIRKQRKSVQDNIQNGLENLKNLKADEEKMKMQAAKSSRNDNEGGARRPTENPYNVAPAKGDTIQDAIDENARAQSRQQADLDALSQLDTDLGTREKALEDERKRVDSSHRQAIDSLRMERLQAHANGDKDKEAGIDAEIAQHNIDRDVAIGDIDGQLSTIKSARQSVQSGIKRGQTSLKRLQDDAKEMGQMQQALNELEPSGRSINPVVADHEEREEDIRRQFMTLGNFEDRDNLSALSHAERAEYYRQKADQLRTDAGKRKAVNVAAGFVAGAATLGYGGAVSPIMSEIVSGEADAYMEKKQSRRMNTEPLPERDERIAAQVRYLGGVGIVRSGSAGDYIPETSSQAKLRKTGIKQDAAQVVGETGQETSHAPEKRTVASVETATHTRDNGGDTGISYRVVTEEDIASGRVNLKDVLYTKGHMNTSTVSGTIQANAQKRAESILPSPLVKTHTGYTKPSQKILAQLSPTEPAVYSEDAQQIYERARQALDFVPQAYTAPLSAGTDVLDQIDKIISARGSSAGGIHTNSRSITWSSEGAYRMAVSSLSTAQRQVLDATSAGCYENLKTYYNATTQPSQRIGDDTPPAEIVKKLYDYAQKNPELWHTGYMTMQQTHGLDEKKFTRELYLDGVLINAQRKQGTI